MPSDIETDVTDDAILGGRLRLRQPRKGHRVGHDAVLLAAATGVRPGEHLVEFGAGVGAAGLAVARRCAQARVTLVEIDEGLASLARHNCEANGLANSGVVTLDVTAPAEAFAAAGLPPGCAARVLMNPPFDDPARHRASPDARRQKAHLAEDDTVPRWLAAAARVLAPAGVLTLIWRADRLPDLLQELEAAFGAVAVVPVYPGPDKPAIRILIRAVKGSRGPMSMEPGIVLSDAAGQPSEQAEAVLRHGAVLALAER